MATQSLADLRPTTTHKGHAATTRIRLPRWGWIEWCMVAQTAMPALMYVPGLARIRLVTRIASFAIALLAWVAIMISGRRTAGRWTFPPARWLAASAVWLVVMVAHPSTNSLASGLGQWALNVAIMSPAFWAPAAVRDPKQIGRMMMILLVCAAAGTLMGILQFYRPGDFEPPEIAILKMRGEDLRSDYSYKAADGRMVLRPCGLTDTPGGAALAGGMTCMLGLAFALRTTLAKPLRLVSLGMAVAGVAVIYFSQVRMALLMQIISVLALMVLFGLQRNVRMLIRLLIAAGLIMAGSVFWALRSGGDEVMRRFTALLEERTTTVYYNARGYYMWYAFTYQIWEQPLGGGLGRWGQIYYYFGDKTPSADHGETWMEIQAQAWIQDGGIPLVVLESIAVLLGLWSAVRIALRCPDKDLAYWAAVTCAINLSVLSACFSSMPFISPMGIQFWVMMGAVHGAAALVRAEQAAAIARQRPVAGIMA